MVNIQNGGGKMEGRSLGGDAIVQDDTTDTFTGGAGGDAFFHEGINTTAGDLLDILADKTTKEPAVDLASPA